MVCSSCGVPFEQGEVTPAVQDSGDMDPTAFDLSDSSSKPIQIAHFQLRRLLGRGGFGEVWLAEDFHLGRLVALKLPKSTLKDAKLLHEAKTAAKLRHPHIVSIFEVGITEDQIFIASEYVAGSSLRERITVSRLPIGSAVQLLVTVARAVAHAHQHGVVHRDLKPENILLDSEEKPFVTDFGIAKQLSENETISTDGQIIGTISYMSPEQAEGNTRATDRRSDVYALGTILFELLTEYRPFRGNARGVIHQKLYEDPPSPRKLVPNLPRDLETICLKCLQREPSKRYQTASELADELERFEKGLPILARPITRMEMLWRWCKRNQAVTGLIAGVFISLSIGLLGISYFWLQSEHNAKLRQEALYRTRMVLASNLWQSGDIKSLKQTLDEYREGPASQLRDFEWHHYSNALKPYLQITDHGDSVVDVAISRDGDLFASAGRDRIIKVWQRDIESPLRTLEAGEANVISVEFSPTEERLFSTHRDGFVRLWNPRQHDREVRRFNHGTGLTCARLDPDGKKLFTIDTRGGVRRWDIATGEQQGEWSDFGPGLTDLCFAENGRWAAIGSRPGRVWIWDFESDELVQDFDVGASVAHLTFIEHDQAIASIGIANSMAFTSLDDQSTEFISYDRNVIGDVDYLSDWDQIAMVSSSAGLRLVDGDRAERRRLSTHALSPGVLDHSGESGVLVVGSGDGTVKLLAIDRLQEPEVLWQASHIRDIAFVDQRRVATCLGDGSIHVWDLESGERRQLVSPSGREMLAIATEPHQGRLFATGMVPSILQIDWNSGQSLPPIKQKVGGFGAIGISHDGKRLATGSRSGVVLVHQISDAEVVAAPIAEMIRSQAQILDLAFAATPDQLVVAYSDNKLIVYEVPGGDVLREVTLEWIPQTILICKSGETCFVGTRSGEIVIVNLLDGSTRSIDAHQGRINSLAFFPGEERLVSAGRDQIITIWDVESMERVGMLQGHEHQIFSLAVSADGQCIASGGLAGDLRIWMSGER